ncbi:MAG TPA: DUF4440 domain-containing protein [Flavobacterium sp.]|nr:DUF4440 domain-containing protein [Flavobacterium sp.]
MKIFALLLVGLMALPVHSQKTDTERTEALKKEIVKTEAAFRDLLKAKGPAVAFWTYAAPDAVIKRDNDSLIKGRDNIRNYYARPSFQKANVDWKPDFVEVSADGTMAYTYGKFVWKYNDKDGKPQSYTGVFHTVWRRMADGTWKYVWD